jgi:hypothetical protein
MPKIKLNYIKSIIFLILLCIIFAKANSIFVLKWSDRNPSELQFHSEPKNSIQVLFLGASSFFKGISPLVMWNEYGFTSYVRSTSMQSPLGLYNSLLEALDNQSPNLVVLDGIILLNDFNYQQREPGVRKYVDPKPLSVRKVQFIYNLWKYGYNPDVISMFFPLFRYHDRWSTLEKSDFSTLKLNKIIDTKGQSITYVVSPQSYSSEYMHKSETKPRISKDSRKFFDQIIRVCNEKSINVIFITLPRLNWSYKKHISVQTYADENNIPYIDLSFPEEITKIDLNLRTDFFDSGHVNLLGSQKTVIYMGNILVNKFKLTNHKDDVQYDYWNDQYSLYKEYYLDHQIENPSDNPYFIE